MRSRGISLIAVGVLLVLAAVLAWLGVNAPYDLARDKFAGGPPRVYFDWACLCALAAGGIFLWSSARARANSPKRE